MLNKLSFRSLGLLLALTFIIQPFAYALALAQEADATQKSAETAKAIGCSDGERRAKEDINTTTWLAIGCLAGLIGYLIALSEPNPPATELLGKEPEYVASYTDCYRNEGKSIKSKNALTGCLVGTAASVALIVIIAASSSDNSGYYY